jgi:hypothetical protein
MQTLEKYLSENKLIWSHYDDPNCDYLLNKKSYVQDGFVKVNKFLTDTINACDILKETFGYIEELKEIDCFICDDSRPDDIIFANVLSYCFEKRVVLFNSTKVVDMEDYEKGLIVKAVSDAKTEDFMLHNLDKRKINRLNFVLTLVDTESFDPRHHRKTGLTIEIKKYEGLATARNEGLNAKFAYTKNRIIEMNNMN